MGAVCIEITGGAYDYLLKLGWGKKMIKKTKIIKANSLADVASEIKKIKDLDKVKEMIVYAIVSPKIKLKELNKFVRESMPKKADITLKITMEKSREARGVSVILRWKR